MNLKHLSNNELHTQTLAVAAKERISTMEVLWHLREIESRMLYAQKGYRDLKEYCVKELKYSEGSAWRRIAAMKVLKEVPEIKEQIESGNLNLTQLSMARTHFREVRATQEEKKEVLLSLENQNTRSTERFLAECRPESKVSTPEVKEKAIKGHKLEVTLIIDEELQKELEEIQVLLGKPMSKLELLKLMTKEKLENLRKSAQKNTQISKAMITKESVSRQDTRKESNPKIPPQKVRKSISQEDMHEESRPKIQERKAQPLRSAPASRSRYVSKITLRQMKLRDQHQCQYKDPQTQNQCSAKFYLHTEHIIPFSKGGTHELTNLQLLCPAHNRLRAIQEYGTNKMKNYLSGL